ncbi:M4 family metallopeptidase [Streptomyces sp. NPDC058739]|uniref:M4 family metallopeptidase n=1 Tax=Streptomyces sp. NPDC058739 TaxID=3346618 RepID=UPI0036A57987
MSRIRPSAVRRLSAAAAVALLAGMLSPAAGAAPAPTALENAVAALSRHGGELGLTEAQSVKVRDVIVDADGTQHVRYDRTYRRLPVLGGDFVLHLAPDGRLTGTSRATSREISLPGVTPALTAANAADLAARALRATRPGSVLRRLTSRPELVVDALHGAPRLAWRTRAAALDGRGNPVARTVLTDATTGARLAAWDTLETASGEGNSLYGGTVALETTASGSSYQLKDGARGGTFTGDAAGQSDLCLLGTLCLSRAPATVLTDTDNRWGDGTTADRASAAVDAQYGTATTWDYFDEAHGRKGIAGDGRGSYNRVHYGNRYANAFWDDTCFCMTYGDGDGTQLGPLVSLDVAGHEMSHGVTSKTAALVYSGESGGLNEATSDVFGTLVEFHAANAADPGDWLIGEKIVRPGLGRTALRYMDRPSRDGKSADCWTSATGSLDVHHSSGVANHFAFLLAEGSGTRTLNGVTYDSPTCDGSTVDGIGRAALGAVWYRALTLYMTSSTNYAGARTATLNAARDLYGADSAQYAAVGAAWSAVGVR